MATSNKTRLLTLLQGIALGTWLRQRYLEKHKLLQPPLVSADGEAGKGLYLRTTPHNRSIISLRGVLAGLLNEGASISSSMPKKVSVQAELPEQESLYANVANCKVLGKLMKQAEKKAHSECWQLGMQDRDLIPTGFSHLPQVRTRAYGPQARGCPSCSLLP